MRSTRSVVHASIASLVLGLVAGCHEPMDTAGAAEIGEDAFDDARQAALAQNPEGVSFTVRLLSPTGVFHQGERVPVELSFTSRLPGRYRLDRAFYDRSGRLSSETYRVAPVAGTSDPLADYFDDGIFPGGGIRSSPELGEEPQTLEFDLAEWIRFDRPGVYQLYAQSSRVERDGEEVSPATSNVVALEILPADPAWSAGALREAADAYDAASAAGDQQARRAAARDLRFLGTADAAAEIVARFRANDFDLMFGLMASPHREAAVSLLEERLDAPDFPVTRMFLDTLVRLRARLDRPARLGPCPSDPLAAELWGAAAREAREARERVLARYAARLADRLESKAGAARATSVDTLLVLTFHHHVDSKAPAPAWSSRVVALLPEVFFDLPGEEQLLLLEHRFREVAGPAMIPVVRRLVEDPTTRPDLRAVALRRLHEVAPAEGRER
jgi:hypothetical protein